MTEQEMMELWTRMATPGVEHELLTRYTGEWQATMRSWMDPAQPPAESTGTATFGTMFEGRIRTETFTGDVMGIRFEGWGMTGFDNVTKKYWLTWCDNMSTGLFCTTQGTLSPDKKVITFTGAMTRATGESIKGRYLYRLHSPDHFTFETFEFAADGSERKSMEIDYRRS